jgi:trigger factor
MASLKQGLREELLKEKESMRKREVAQKIMETLTKSTDIPVPARLLQKRLDAMIGDAMGRFKADRLTDEEARNLIGNLRRDFEPRAEAGIKGEIILSKIADKESIKVDDNEIQERIKKMAEDSRRSYAEIEAFYNEHNLWDNLRGSIVEEKTIDFLRDIAVIQEKA